MLILLFLLSEDEDEDEDDDDDSPRTSTGTREEDKPTKKPKEAAKNQSGAKAIDTRHLVDILKLKCDEASKIAVVKVGWIKNTHLKNNGARGILGGGGRPVSGRWFWKGKNVSRRTQHPS